MCVSKHRRHGDCGEESTFMSWSLVSASPRCEVLVCWDTRVVSLWTFPLDTVSSARAERPSLRNKFVFNTFTCLWFLFVQFFALGIDGWWFCVKSLVVLERVCYQKYCLLRLVIDFDPNSSKKFTVTLADWHWISVIPFPNKVQKELQVQRF